MINPISVTIQPVIIKYGIDMDTIIIPIKLIY